MLGKRGGVKGVRNHVCTQRVCGLVMPGGGEGSVVAQRIRRIWGLYGLGNGHNELVAMGKATSKEIHKCAMGVPVWVKPEGEE